MTFARTKRSKRQLANILGMVSLVALTTFLSALAMADPLDDVDEIPAIIVEPAEPASPVKPIPTLSPWYVGANIGQSRADIDAREINDHLVNQIEYLLGEWVNTDTISDDENDIGYKIYGGYKINKHYAIEGGYFDLGEFNYKSTTDPAGTVNGEIEVKGLNLDLVGIAPLTERISAFARAGVTYAESDGEFSGTGSVSAIDRSSSERDANYKYGLGVQYAVSESLGLRAEAERYRIKNVIGDDDNVDFYSAGLVYQFGKSPPAVATTPEPMKMLFSADSLFDFNSSILKTAGKRQLDQFAADLKGFHFDVIRVTGHTDRLGPQDYNLWLSTRRATAVKRYLVETLAIPADKITAQGIDGSEPVTRPGECVGEEATEELIACLQPDRRVEVEVFGVKP